MSDFLFDRRSLLMQRHYQPAKSMLNFEARSISCAKFAPFLVFLSRHWQFRLTLSQFSMKNVEFSSVIEILDCFTKKTIILNLKDVERDGGISAKIKL